MIPDINLCNIFFNVCHKFQNDISWLFFCAHLSKIGCFTFDEINRLKQQKTKANC
jgi:hypothetical protein